MAAMKGKRKRKQKVKDKIKRPGETKEKKGSKSSVTEKKEEDDQKFICDICGIMLTSRRSLDTHVNQVHLKSKFYTCEKCGKVLYSYTGFKMHMNGHLGLKPFACRFADCGKKFADASSLRKHQSVHSTDRKFSCEICQKKFKRKYAKKMHIQVVHCCMTLKSEMSEYHRHPCTECGKNFGTKAHLKGHMNTHLGIMPYKCSYRDCVKTFSNSSNLTKHEKLHTGKKPHVCKTCGEAFSRKDYLDNHMFKHTEEKPNVCQICGKGFIQKGNLKIHLRSHSGERPFSCKVCDQGFSHKSNRDKHEQHHKTRKGGTNSRKKKTHQESHSDEVKDEKTDLVDKESSIIIEIVHTDIEEELSRGDNSTTGSLNDHEGDSEVAEYHVYVMQDVAENSTQLVDDGTERSVDRSNETHSTDLSISGENQTGTAVEDKHQERLEQNEKATDKLNAKAKSTSKSFHDAFVIAVAESELS